MAVTTFYLYPDTNTGPYTFCTVSSYAGIDDAFDAVNCPITGSDHVLYLPSGDGASTRNGSGSWGLTAPTSGVSINWIRLHIAGFTRRRAGGSWVAESRFCGAVRPAAVSTYYVVAPTIVDNGGRATVVSTYQVGTLPDYNANTASWAAGSGCCHWYHQYSTNPATASAWTVSELQALVVSLVADTSLTTSPGSVGMLKMQAASGASTRSIRVGGIYVEVNANTAAASIAEKRLMGSAYLRLLRQPTEPVEVVLPVEFADADVGDTVALSSELGPASDGLGWGRKDWQRHYGMVLSKSTDPTQKVVRAQVLDLSRFYADLWFPAITDLAYTEEGQGVPYLDGGGGRTMARNSKAYTKRQSDDALYVEVPVDKERWSPIGVGSFHSTDHQLENNSFSQGSGSTFTGWTNTTAGTGVIAESTADFLFDSTGHRRSANLKMTTGGVGSALVKQWTPVLASGFARVHVISKRIALTGSAVTTWRLERNSDSKFWRDSDGTWQVAQQDNTIATTALAEDVIAHTYSSIVDVTSTEYKLTVVCDDGGVGGDAIEEQVYYATLYDGTNQRQVSARRPPFVTTSAIASELGDVLEVASPTSASAFNPAQGTAMMRLQVKWEHEDLETGYDYVVWENYTDGNDFERIYYNATNATAGTWYFQREVGGSTYAASIATAGATLPNLDDVFKLVARWQSDGGELDKTDHSIALMVQQNSDTEEWATGTAAAPTVSNRTLYLGGSNSAGQCDGFLSRIEIVPLVLNDTEVYRRMGI